MRGKDKALLASFDRMVAFEERHGMPSADELYELSRLLAAALRASIEREEQARQLLADLAVHKYVPTDGTIQRFLAASGPANEKEK